MMAKLSAGGLINTRTSFKQKFGTLKSGLCLGSLICALGLFGCGNKSGDGLLGGAMPGPSSSSSSGSGVSSSGKPVLTAGPNAENQTPAFKEQTRAPEQRSSFTLKAELITSALTSPWGMARLSDGRWLITQRTGSLVIVTASGKISRPIEGLPTVDSSGQGGLLDVSLDPKFASNRWVYISYSEPRDTGKNATAVGRARLSSDETRLENWQVIFTQNPAWNSTLHFGSRLAWDKNGLLYVTLGERSVPDARQYAQDLSTTLGKIIRIQPDGSVPTNNPLVGKAGALPEIWSYGHRNPQGAAIHPVTGELWTLEHGPRGGDEVNRPEGGKNYGWPIIAYGEDYSGAPIGEGITAKAGMEQPIYYWDPVIAPSGITFYQGGLFPSWQNNLLIGSLVSGGLVRLAFTDNKVVGEERLMPELGRVRDVEVDSDGAVWVISDSGQLNRLTPKL